MGKRIATRLTAFAMTKRLVILSAERERIRNTLRGKNGLPQPFTRLRNDGEQGKITVPLRFGGGGLYIPFIYFLKLLPV